MISTIVIVILLVLLFSAHNTNKYNLKVIEDNDRIYREYIAVLEIQVMELKKEAYER